MPGGYAELSTKIVSKSISVQHLVYAVNEVGIKAANSHTIGVFV